MQKNINIQAAASAIMLQAVTAITSKEAREAANKAQEAAKSSQVYNLSSGLLPCVCVAMYDTMLSPSVFEEYMNEGGDFNYVTVDMDDWKTELTKKAQEYIDDEVVDSLKNYGCKGIEADHIWSPKYYNYSQDELIMNVEMCDDWKTIMAAKIADWQGRQDVEQYIRRNWKSSSGYINLMPESLAEILAEDDEDRQLAAYLTLAMVVEGTLKDAGDVMEDLYWRMEDFQDYQQINVFGEYYDNEDDADDMQDLWNDDYRWNNLYWDLFYKIGSPWSHDKSSSRLDGIADCCYSWNADSDGKKMLFWAVKQGLTVADLYKMAA